MPAESITHPRNISELILFLPSSVSKLLVVVLLLSFPAILLAFLGDQSSSWFNLYLLDRLTIQALTAALGVVLLATANVLALDVGKREAVAQAVGVIAIMVVLATVASVVMKAVLSIPRPTGAPQIEPLLWNLLSRELIIDTEGAPSGFMVRQTVLVLACFVSLEVCEEPFSEVRRGIFGLVLVLSIVLVLATVGSRVHSARDVLIGVYGGALLSLVFFNITSSRAGMKASEFRTLTVGIMLVVGIFLFRISRKPVWFIAVHLLLLAVIALIDWLVIERRADESEHHSRDVERLAA